jgi:positive phototaxis protein PixI
MASPRQEERQKILHLAQQGDPETIAALLNHKLRPDGVSVQVSQQQNCLHLALTSAHPTHRDILVEFIRQTLIKLKLETFKIAEIQGYIENNPQPVWVEAIELESLALQKALSAWLQESTTLFSWDTETPQETQFEFLRFSLNAKDTALLPVRYIKAVLKLSTSDILPVPHRSDRVLGIYNWRGEMLWLVDLNRLLGFGEVFNSYQDEVHAIALQVERRILAIVVPGIEDLERYALDRLQPATPGLFAPQLLPFVQGYLAAADSIVLDVPAILNIFAGKQNIS